MDNSFSESYSYRFGGLSRLYGDDGLTKIYNSHVCIVGLGGVGSWVVEALVRSGVGRLSLVDYDEICITNINRQIHSTSQTIGQLKVDVLTERALQINPEVQITKYTCFFSADTEQKILSTPYDYVVDAIDDVKNKCLLLSECRNRNIKIITVGGSGGKKEPWQIQLKDLSQTHGDRLLQKTRKKLRQDFGFSKNPKTKMKIPCVFSAEQPYFADSQGGVTQNSASRPQEAINCSSGLGTVTSVTGAFGFFVSSYVLNQITTN